MSDFEEENLSFNDDEFECDLYDDEIEQFDDAIELQLRAVIKSCSEELQLRIKAKSDIL